MSFFKNFKEDLTQAVSELMPSDEELMEKLGGEVPEEEFIIPEEEFIIPEEPVEEEKAEETVFVMPEDIEAEQKDVTTDTVESSVSEIGRAHV